MPTYLCVALIFIQSNIHDLPSPSWLCEHLILCFLLITIELTTAIYYWFFSLIFSSRCNPNSGLFWHDDDGAFLVILGFWGLWYQWKHQSTWGKLFRHFSELLSSIKRRHYDCDTSNNKYWDFIHFDFVHYQHDFRLHQPRVVRPGSDKLLGCNHFTVPEGMTRGLDYSLMTW